MIPEPIEIDLAQSPPKGKDGGKQEKSCWQCGRSFFTSLELCPDDGARLISVELEEHDPLVGTIFDGRFEILSKLGEGGMGEVYSARRLDFETRVAVKLLKADFARDEGIRKRFMYEARVISNLKHPHAVRLFDFGQTREGDVYMVMELLEGESLADRLSHRFVSYREAFDIVVPVCGVLGESHLRDVIHRDLKPENIYLLQVEGNQEFPKLIDFGIAKHNRAETMTQSGTLWGTPAYMSPEQARGDKVGAPADIYGMGIMLYELISGNLPFHAATQMGYAVKHINEEARPLASIPGLKSVPEELDRFVLSMLAKRPEERPETMDMVAKTLARIREEHFDEELLEKIPAHEVDPLALQRWFEQVPGVGDTEPAGIKDLAEQLRASERLQDTRGVRSPETPEGGKRNRSEELAATAAGTASEEMAQKARATGEQAPVQAPSESMPSGESEVLRAREEEPRGKLSMLVAAGILAAAVVILLLVFTGNGELETGPGAEALSARSLEVASEAAVSAASLQAVHVVFAAREVILAQERESEGEEEVFDFDFLHHRGDEDRGAPASAQDDDALLRQKLEGTF